jgi:thiamine pyrophosphate-dependent acetolactate synthase large subunit-like protein
LILYTSAAFGDLSASVGRLTDACVPTERDWWKQPVETGWERHWDQLEREIANQSDPIEQLPQGGPDPATKIDDVDLIHPAAIIDCLNDQLQGDEIVAGDVGVHLQYAMKYLDLETPNSFLTPESWGGMGHAIPSMIGAKFAAPSRRVLGVVGDGSFQMNASAFFTAVRHNLNITIVLFNNRQHNAITGDQMDQYGATGFTYVDEFDFASLADTVGGIGFSVETPAELSEKLETAIGADGPTIIDIPTEPNII